MERRNFLQNLMLSLGAAGVGGCSAPQCKTSSGGRQKSLPNIVFILADDMGYGDIQAYNPKSKIPTPNLNRLAQQGIRFTDAHSGSAVCTPTRYGLLTGRYCWRSRLKSGVLFPPNDEPLIDDDRLTVAGMLKKYNYNTACIGKWHLGIGWGRDAQGKVDFNKPINHGPTDVGFDEYFGVAASLDMIPYTFLHNHELAQPVTETQPRLNFPKYVRQGPKAKDFDPGKVLDTLTGKAVDYIERSAPKSDPFFLYFPLTAPHKPVWPEDRFKNSTKQGPYGDFVHQVDWSVGQVMKALDKMGVADDTIVVYSSDNGSYMFRKNESEPDHVDKPEIQGFKPSNHRPNGLLRGTKADIWEAGHRVPFIVRWPGVAQAATKSDATICLTDFFATCSEITGYAKPSNVGEDSFSLLPIIEGRTKDIDRPPVIHHSVNGTFALRDGRWKMVFSNGSGGREKPRGKPFQKPYTLFDLKNDPTESTDVIAQYPAIAQRLEKKLKAIMDNGGSK
jgi:arylsulfatase A